MPQQLQRTRDEVISYIQRSLGYPKSCVELDASNFDAAVEEAEIWMAAHLGIMREIEIDVTPGVTDYDLPSDCSEVVEVIYPGAYGNIPMAFPIEGLDQYYMGQWMRSGARYGGMNSTIMQQLQHIETTRRTLGADPLYEWRVQGRKLHIGKVGSAGRAIVRYGSNQIDYDYLNIQQLHMLRRYAHAQAMMILGRIRSKFSEVPASGSKVTLNGDALIASAENEIALLDEKIKNFQAPLGFTTG